MLKNVNNKAQDVGKMSQKEEIVRRRFVGPEKWRNSNKTDKLIGNRGSKKEIERRKILGPQDDFSNVHNFGSMNIKCLTLLFVFCHKKRLTAHYL